jgi:hypothetical protein
VVHSRIAGRNCLQLAHGGGAGACVRVYQPSRCRASDVRAECGGIAGRPSDNRPYRIPTEERSSGNIIAWMRVENGLLNLVVAWHLGNT